MQSSIFSDKKHKINNTNILHAFFQQKTPQVFFWVCLVFFHKGVVKGQDTASRQQNNDRSSNDLQNKIHRPSWQPAAQKLMGEISGIFPWFEKISGSKREKRGEKHQKTVKNDDLPFETQTKKAHPVG